MYTKQIILPSATAKNSPYPDNPELQKEITLKMITTGVEKKIYGTWASDSLNNLIKECTEPQVDANLLLPADRFYILVQLREFSYGDEYHVRGICPICGAVTESKISLTDVEVFNLPEDWKEPVEVFLPILKVKVGLKFLREGDNRKIDERAQEYFRTMKIPVMETKFTERLARRIVTIDGEQVDIIKARNFVQDLPARDRVMIDMTLDNFRLGYSETTSVICSQCGNSFDADFRMTGEFFRPRYDE